MITEDYVSFEVAKLLKEKGFDEQCTHMYDSQHTLYSTFEQCRQITRNNSNWIHYVGKLNICPIATPTLQMAMKWIREKYKILISPYALSLGWYFEIFDLANTDISGSKPLHKVGIPFKEEVLDSYESACEAALKYCLTNLIK